MDFAHQWQEQNSPNLRAVTNAGDLETQADLSRHRPVGLFSWKSFSQSPGPAVLIWALWPYVALAFVRGPSCEAFLLSQTDFFFHSGIQAAWEHTAAGTTPQSYPPEQIIFNALATELAMTVKHSQAPTFSPEPSSLCHRHQLSWEPRAIGAV